MSLMPCLDCGKPSNGSRCIDCQTKRIQKIESNRVRASSYDRGYDREWQRLRKMVLDRDKWVCYLCNKKLVGRDATVDHIIPLSVDPNLRLTVSNLAACCRSCNSKKINKT